MKKQDKPIDLAYCMLKKIKNKKMIYSYFYLFLNVFLFIIFASTSILNLFILDGLKKIETIQLIFFIISILSAIGTLASSLNSLYNLSFYSKSYKHKSLLIEKEIRMFKDLKNNKQMEESNILEFLTKIQDILNN